MKNIHGGKHATLLKLTLLHGCFSSFLNRTNGTKSRKISHLYKGFQRLRHVADVRISLQSGTSRKKIISNVKVYAIDHFETSQWIYSISYIICFNITGELLCSRSKQRTCAYQGVRNVCFSENFACFIFLLPPSWDLPFCLITDDFYNTLRKRVHIIFFDMLII